MEPTNTGATAHIQSPIKLFPVWMNSHHLEEKENAEFPTVDWYSCSGGKGIHIFVQALVIRIRETTVN
jgi:hypothetical protein